MRWLIVVGALGCGARTDLELARADAAPSIDAAVDVVTAPAALDCENPGLEPRAAWPMLGACQDHRARTPVVGPSSARLAWTSLDANGDVPLAIDAKGRIYATNTTGHLVAIDPDGTTRWTAGGLQPTQSSPVIARDGSVLYASADFVVVFSPDGKQLYKSAQVTLWTSYYSSPVMGRDGSWYFTDSSHELVAHSWTQDVLWITSDGTYNDTSPAIGRDGTIYTSTAKNRLRAFDAAGKLQWQLPKATDGRPYFQGPVIADDGTLHVADFQGLHAVRPDGSSAWDVAGGVAPPALGADGTLYLGSRFASNTRTFRAIRRDGTVAWTRPTDDDFASQPAIGGDGTIYALSNGGTLWAFRPDGTVVWSYQLGKRTFHTAPAIGPDGTLYVCIDRLYAFRR